jgi:formylglycine-generating enzyme required for sulfatase activity
LRSFGPEDWAFFLDLLPGPRDHTRLPESIRFWKVRIESPDPDRAFAVGLLYGPSGSGKSSLVKAGLLPQLGPAVVPVYVEVTRESTEDRLLAQLRKKCSGLGSRASLRTTFARLRHNRGLPASAKLLVVLDQFEQWLHAHAHDMESTELVAALRQADGEHVQVLLLVRSDFWMSISRLFESLRINLDRASNTRAVELFGESHAHHVLHLFGTAYGQLPAEWTGLTTDQADFLARAVRELSGDEGVIPVRLSLFADMMKNRSWTPAELEKVGGTKGVGVKFLEDVCSQPDLRARKDAAQALLQALLPAPGADLKGRMRSRRELAAAAGLPEGSHAFAQLLETLNREYVLTPTDPPLAEPVSPASSPEAAADVPQVAYYQLTHDYLVPSLREWLTEEKQKTWKGRAELRLAERAALWNDRPQNRLLPAWWEWAGIQLLLRPGTWTPPQRRMMRHATWYHLLRTCGFLVALALAGWAAFEVSGSVQAQARITELSAAEIGELPVKIKELTPYRRWADSRLLQVARDGSADAKKRRNANLALLPTGSAQVDSLAERLLAGEPEEVGVIGRALRDYQPGMADRFWEVLEDRAAHADRRLRAACALAAWEPGSLRWGAVARDLVKKLVTEPLALLPGWQKELEPVGEVLVPPLLEIVGDGQRPETEHAVAVHLLAHYARNSPETLAELVESADVRHAVVLLPALLKREQRAVASMDQELSRTLTPDWKDAPLDPAWTTPDAALVRKLEAAQGLLNDRFAFCQTMALDEFLAVADGLRPSGYRPTCFRPYTVGGAVQVAAIWTRDGRGWQRTCAASAAEIRRQDGLQRQQGYLPLDVACYVSGAGGQPPGARYAALWAVPDAEVTDARLDVDVPEDAARAVWPRLQEAGFHSRTQLSYEIDGHRRCCAVWYKTTPPLDNVFHEVGLDLSAYESRLTPSELLTDVRLAPRRRGVDQTKTPATEYSAVWRSSSERVSVESHGLDPARHRERCRGLTEEGYRPVAISVASVGEGQPPVTASAWQRPVVPEAAKEALAKRQARAAVTLLRLDQPERLWRLLPFHPDPRLRTHAIHLLRPFGVDAQVLVRRLEQEGDVSARRALLLALGEFPADCLADPARQRLLGRLRQLNRDDPDPGIHSAVEWLLRRWGQGNDLASTDRELVSRQPLGDRRWYVNGERQTLAVLRDPPEFWMGSLASEPDRIAQDEAMRRVRIPHSFAIAAKEVTVEEFQRFLDANPSIRDKYTRRPGSGREPVVFVTWFEAVQYCRWLSEREQVPRDQMCYPTLDEIKEGMELPPDLLARTGYRLPTEAEWEYSCRAGTETSRACGSSDELLANYAWYGRNSDLRARPVGQLKPNDFGLFDMYGNAGEWCQDRSPAPWYGSGGTSPEPGNKGAAHGSKNQFRAWRGSSFSGLASRVRSAAVGEYLWTTRSLSIGFRIARTVR